MFVYKYIKINTYRTNLRTEMKNISIILLVIMVVPLMASEKEEKYRGPSEEDVVVLDADNLESTIYESE